MNEEHKADDDWQLPVLDRIREGFLDVAERDRGAAQKRTARRRRSFGLGVAIAATAALIAVVILPGDRGHKALASVRDAPAAVADAATFRFRTETTLRKGAQSESYAQSGVIDLATNSSRSRLVAPAGVIVEQIRIGRDLYFRSTGRGPDAAWQYLALGVPAQGERSVLGSPASPLSARVIESLRAARNVEAVDRDRTAADGRLRHYRLPLSAAQLEAFRQRTNGRRPQPVTGHLYVWLDQEGRPRRVTAFLRTADATYTVDTRYSDYGNQVRIAAPSRHSPAQPGESPAAEDPLVVLLPRVVARERP